LQSFIKIAKPIVCSLLLMGCSHIGATDKPLNDISSPQLKALAVWGDNEFSGKAFRIVKVDDYVLPKNSQMMARFDNGEIHLIGTCNPTWGYYKSTEDSFILGAMGNLGQTACTELFEKPDGSIAERIPQTPQVITEDKFIDLGDKTLKIQSYENEVHFIGPSGYTLIVLELRSQDKKP